MPVVQVSRENTGHWVHRPVSRLLVCCLLFPILIACTVVPLAPPVVKIGLAGPFEGEYRYVGYDAIYAARLALRETNAAGGVAGYVVELVAYDDQGTIPGARTVARNLILDSQVVAVIGHFRDETTEATRSVYERAGLPLLVAGTVEGAADVGRSELYCQLLSYLRNALTHGEGERLTAQKVQWIASDDTTIPNCGDGKNDQTVLVSSHLPPPADVGAVLLDLDPVAAAEIVAKLRVFGWQGIVGGGPPVGSTLFAQVTDPMGVIFISPQRWPDIAGHDAEFSSAFRSLGPHVPQPGPFALTAYRATRALLAAIDSTARQGKAPSREILANALSWHPATALYIYRWGPMRVPELIEQEETARSE